MIKMCMKFDYCCFCCSLATGTKVTSVLFTVSSAFAVMVYAPLALFPDKNMPPTRHYFYCSLALLAVFEVVLGGLLIHGAFRKMPQFIWPWVILAGWKGIVLLFLTLAGMVALAVNANVDLMLETCPIISMYFIYAVLLMYLACVVNSRRRELVMEVYWAEKHLLQNAKTQYFYL